MAATTTTSTAGWSRRPQITRRGTEDGSGLAEQRWVGERAIALLGSFRRLGIHRASLSIGCALTRRRHLSSLR